MRVTSGGAPVYIWPGGGITYMVDVAAMPDNAFGYVPTPAIVAPDRVHHAAGRLSRPRRPYGLGAAGRGGGRARRGSQTAGVAQSLAVRAWRR